MKLILAISLTLLCWNGFANTLPLLMKGGVMANLAPSIPLEVVKVHIKLKNKKTSSCTGTLIGRDFILTAGHCFKKEGELKYSKTSDIGIQFFESSDSKMIKAQDVFIHPLFQKIQKGEDGAWRDDGIFDLAIVKLQKPANATGIEIESLDFSGHDLMPQLFFSGVGTKDLSGTEKSDFPYWGGLRPHASEKDCAQFENQTNPLHEFIPGGIALRGDSGGPVFQFMNEKIQILGVVSVTTAYSESKKMNQSEISAEDLKHAKVCFAEITRPENQIFLKQILQGDAFLPEDI